MTELELLALQHAGSFDDRGRIRGFHGVTIARHGERALRWIGSEVPAALAAELAHVSQVQCRALVGGEERESVSYVVEAIATPRIDARIVRSDEPREPALRDANP